MCIRSLRKTFLRLRVLSAATLLACARGDDGTKATDSTGSAGAGARAPGSGAPLVYVTNEDGNSISIVDSGSDSVLSTMPVGKRPRGIRVSPDGSTIFVAVSGNPKAPPGVDERTLPPPDRAADGIAVIDARTHTLKTTFKSGQDPETFDVTSDGKKVYVSNEDAGTVSVVDGGTGRVLKAIEVGGEPEGVTLTPDGRHVYVTSEEGHAIYVIDTARDSVIATIDVARRPRAVAFTPDGRKAYVTAEVGGTVDVIDVAGRKRARSIRIPGTGAKPMGAAVAADGKLAYVTTGRGGTVAVIDTGADSVVAVIAAGQRPWGIAITPDGRKAYTANGPSNDVSVIDLATRRVVDTIKVGSVPWGVAIAPAAASP
jgi:YVTN family beta-propeller protein